VRKCDSLCVSAKAVLFYHSGCKHPLRHILRSRVSGLRNRRIHPGRLPKIKIPISYHHDNPTRLGKSSYCETVATTFCRSCTTVLEYQTKPLLSDKPCAYGICRCSVIKATSASPNRRRASRSSITRWLTNRPPCDDGSPAQVVIRRFLHVQL